MVHHIIISLDPSSSKNVNTFKEWCSVNQKSHSVQVGTRVQSTQEAKNYLTDFGYYNIGRWRETSFHFDTLGPIGCFLSHREVWKICIQRNETTWVFEEGVVSYDTNRMDTLDTQYSDYDLILGHSVPVIRLLKQTSLRHRIMSDGSGLQSIDKIYFGTKCYRITPRFATHLLYKSCKFDLHVDSFICCVAMYDEDIFKSGRTTHEVVSAKSAGTINHSMDLSLVNGITMISGIIVSVIIIIYLIHRNLKCKQSLKYLQKK